jgi:hypothetical protein
MYTLGIPNRQYRRTTQVLGPALANPITYDVVKQDDGFYMFSFPEVDKYEFKDIVLLLKNNGITTIGADNHLTEKKIMKLMNILKEQENIDENTIIDKLKETLVSWEQPKYKGGIEGCEKSNHYFEDIKDIIENYEDEESMQEQSELPYDEDQDNKVDYDKMHNVELVATYKDKFGVNSAKGLTRDELIKGLKLGKGKAQHSGNFDGDDSETKNPNSFEVDALVNNKETKVLIDYVESNTGSFPKKVTIEWERDRDDMSNRPVRSKQDDENSDYAKYWIEDHAEDLEFKPEDFIEDPSNPDEPEMLFTAISKDKMWEFAVNVLVPSNFNDSKNIIEILWDTLEITQGQSRSPLSNVSQLTLEPEDMDDTYDDLVIIGSGHLDIENDFRERPSQTNSEYAKIGQEYVKTKYGKVTDGNIEKALDFIYSQINENFNTEQEEIKRLQIRAGIIK